MELRRQIIAETAQKMIVLWLNVSVLNPPEPPATPAEIPNQTSPPIDFSFKSYLRPVAIALSGCVLAASLILVVIYLLLKRFSRRRRSEGAAQPNQDFMIGIGDEPYHVWYIKTAGLDQPTIEAISVVPFKKGEGKVDGSDCAICLGEFQEGEMLRVLPKCRHAFHVPCIDTWLRSHVNCPICRSLIADPEQNASSSNLDHSEGESEHIEPLPVADSEFDDEESEIAKEVRANQESEPMDCSTSVDSDPRRR